MKPMVKETAELLELLPEEVLEVVYDLAVMLAEKHAPYTSKDILTKKRSLGEVEE